MYTEILLDQDAPPNCACPKGCSPGLPATLKAKLTLYTQKVCDTILINMGHQVSIKYMPSQIATLSLYIACKILFQLDIEYMPGEFSQTEIAL